MSGLNSKDMLPVHGSGFGVRADGQVTRQHKKDQWALDEVISHTEVQLGRQRAGASFRSSDGHPPK